MAGYGALAANSLSLKSIKASFNKAVEKIVDEINSDSQCIISEQIRKRDFFQISDNQLIVELAYFLKHMPGYYFYSWPFDPEIKFIYRVRHSISEKR